MSTLSPDNIRLFIRDELAHNRLIDELEFDDDEIANYKSFALQLFNLTPPLTNYTENNLPPNTGAIILYGTLAHMYGGRAAHAARNQMSYSDGGLTIPIEERYQYYSDLSNKYHTLFRDAAKNWKIATNMEGGMSGSGSWGEVGSDFGLFPTW